MTSSCRSARSTGMPRMTSTTSRTLRGEIRTFLARANTSIRPLLLDAGGALGRLAAGVTAEVTRRSELAELVTDHVLGDVDRDVAAPVVHSDRVADHLREDRRVARPGLEDALLAAAVHGLDARQQLRVDVWPLLQRSRHGRISSGLPALAPPHDQPVRRLLVLASLDAVGRLAPARLGTGQADRRLALAAAVWVIARRHRRSAHDRPPA